MGLIFPSGCLLRTPALNCVYLPVFTLARLILEFAFYPLSHYFESAFSPLDLVLSPHPLIRIRVLSIPVFPETPPDCVAPVIYHYTIVRIPNMNFGVNVDIAFHSGKCCYLRVLLSQEVNFCYY